MSEASNTELIEELRLEATVARERTRPDPEGYGVICHMEADEDLLDRAATALESLTATLTETEADLQVARAVIKRAHDNATHLADAQQSWIDAGRHEQAISREAIRDRANEIAAILKSAPSPALESVKADTATEVSDEMVDRAANALDQNFNPDCYPVMAAMFRDYARTAIEAALRPVATEGESRG